MKGVRAQNYQRHRSGDDEWVHDGDKVPFFSLAAAAALTLGFSLIELFAGFIGNSLALIGDAGHMATDSMGLVFALAAALLSRKGADAGHSYGHGRIQVLAAFVNSLAMAALVLWLFVQAVGRITDPQPVAGGTVMTVAAIGLVINILVAWVLSRGEKTLNTRAAFMHVLGDLLGSLAAIAAGALVYFGGERFAVADPILSFAVCLLLVKSLWSVLVESVQVLIEAVPEGVSYGEVGDALSAVPGVHEVHDLHVWTITPGHGAVSAHLHVGAQEDFQKVLDEARGMIAQRFGISHVTLQLERCSGQCGGCCGSGEHCREAL